MQRLVSVKKWDRALITGSIEWEGKAMLSAQRIMSAIAADKYSKRKKQARTGQRYYDGRHDILDARIFYIDQNGKIQEDVTKSNIRIPHPFFQEIADQEVSYILSGGFISGQRSLNWKSICRLILEMPLSDRFRNF